MTPSGNGDDPLKSMILHFQSVAVDREREQRMREEQVVVGWWARCFVFRDSRIPRLCHCESCGSDRRLEQLRYNVRYSEER